MGMFDSVTHVCDCGGEVEWQSKAGECELHSYSLDDVPTEIARDIASEEKCCRQCGKVWTINISPRAPLTVRMYVQESGESE